MTLARWTLVLSFLILISVIPGAATDIPPIAPDELKMTSEPLAPGAPAIILFRQVDRDDRDLHEFNFVRIKILKEEGRKYADIELRYLKDARSISDLKARTIQPDGRVNPFSGKPFDKTVIKAKGIRYLAKTFTMSDVQVGSIIEYSYTERWNDYIYDSHWILSDELFTKRAKFSLTPSGEYAVRWIWNDFPANCPAPKYEGGIVRLEATNIPAFETEDYMPPENELKARVDFIYSNDSEKDPVKYWKNIDKALYQAVQEFADKRKAMEQAVATVVQPNDPPAAKLEKLYARVQQIRNLSFEKEKTQQEEKREKRKGIHNVEDVWKRGYGDGGDITWLYMALVRVAGFEAYPVFVSRRNEYFFDPATPDGHRLNDTVVLVKANGKDLYLDPGTLYTPFGLLPWSETAVRGLKLDKDGGSWVTTTLPESGASRVERKADFKVSDNGSLDGKLTLTYTGLEALWRRIEERDEDDADRRKFLEDEVKGDVPASVDVELTNKPDWASSSPALVAEFKLTIPGWVAGAGRKAMLPVGIFSSDEKRVFGEERRVHNIYFHFPFQKEDDLSISLPEGWKVSSLPSAQNQDAHVVLYSLKAENDKGTIRITRKINVDLLLVDQKYYPSLRNFYQVVRSGDEQQIVLQPGTASASN
jgi:hypothetical protein